MTYSVHNTSSWPREMIMYYAEDIVKAFQKLADRFPADISVSGLIQDAESGNKALWVVLNEENEFVSLAMTQIRTVESTGKKIACVMDLAGKDHKVYSRELNQALERWAKVNGADWYAIEGRPGWGKIAKKYGYEPYAVQWRKKVE